MGNPIKEMDDILMHYGMPRRSGRYPWGSGKDPYQHTRDLLARVEELKKEGWKETPENIMNEFHLTTTQYRAQKGLAVDLRRMDQVAAAKSLAADGLGPTAIAKKMSERYGIDINESTVRSLLDEERERRMMQAKNTADFIREQIKEYGIVDIGSGTEIDLNVSKEKLNQAIEILKSEGYVTQVGGVPQVTNTGKQTITKVIGPPGMEKKDFYDFKNGEVNIHSLNEYITRDGGETYEKKFHYPESLDSSRLKVRYAEEGGIEKDGVIELRRGVPDLSLGDSHYAQVRIMVDGTHYLKGMAVYSDDMPDGVDVIFNTNKHLGTPMLGDKDNTVLKNIKKDPENPFGSAIKDISQGGQYWYTDKDGNKKLGLINKRADEGDWSDWKDKLPAQFLSKQPKEMAQKQLDLALADKRAEYDDIMSVTNPTIKKHLLNKFADECDSAAVHLQAAALPGQKYHVIVPMPSLKDNEVYAPNYENGTKLALVRYPHGGTFEIPIVTVNNKHAVCKKLLGTDATDAICINSKVAERLSGADFDGDTVMCIPTHDSSGKVRIASVDPRKTKGFESIVDFDSKSYKIPEGDTKTKRMKDTQKQMGMISNLITDMTLQGASNEEIARAVKHSMVVIDAEKHGLDYKRSELDNNIAALKKKYQPKDPVTGKSGASTLISRASGQVQVDKRQGNPIVNLKGTKNYDPTKPEGSLMYKTADNLTYTTNRVNKKTGEVITTIHTRHDKSTNMAETNDARTLISQANTPMERIYADFANNMKALANKSRVSSANAGKIAYNKKANTTYKAEVDSLMEKLRNAERNKPRERQAQVIANAEVARNINKVKAELRKQHPNATEKELNKLVRKEIDIKKASQKALSNARNEVGSISRRDRAIEITDREWDAIQAGAISENYLNRILNNADIDKLRQRATPKQNSAPSQAKINKIKSMSASNYTLAEIAKACNLSPTTVSKILKE